MSRRPFSHMFFEILNGKGNPNITDKFSSDVLKNKEKFFSLFNENISFADQLSNGFYKANYAEQFFNEKGEPLDLIRLLPYFNDSIRNSSFLNDLLKNGVLSTTMISMMNTEMVTNDVRITDIAKQEITKVFTPYYVSTILDSIVNPKERGIFSLSNKENILELDLNQFEDVDYISPPFLLDASDAMGRYRNGAFYKPYQSEKFGSAIIEFRNIQQAKSLKSKNNYYEQAGFLTIPDFLDEEVANLFNLLCKLTLQEK